MRIPHKLLMVAAALLIVAAGLAINAAPAQAQSTVTHVVQPGETLSKIARRYCTTWQEIHNMNRAIIGPDPSLVRPGMRLTVVNRCTTGGGGGGGNAGGVWDRGPRQHATGTFNSPFYTVAWGDTLTSIGQRFGVTVANLRSANGISGNNINPGQVLLIPGAGGGTAPPQPTPAPGGLERVNFATNAISASRTGVVQMGVPKRYILAARGGQTMEVFTRSFGEGLSISVATVAGAGVAMTGTNGQLNNAVAGRLPSTTDYIVTITPVIQPEGMALTFDITFVIR